MLKLKLKTHANQDVALMDPHYVVQVPVQVCTFYLYVKTLIYDRSFYYYTVYLYHGT